MRSKKLFLLAFLLFVVYFMQGVAYSVGSFISQSCLLLFLCIGMYAYFKSLATVSVNPAFVNVWMIFFLMHCFCFILSPKVVYGTLYESIGKVETLDQFKNIAMFSLSFFIAYATARYNYFSQKQILAMGLILLVLSIARYFYQMVERQELLEKESVTNNMGYLILSVLPCMMLVIKRYKAISIISVLAIICFVIMSSKRGSIVCLIAMLLFSLYYYIKINKLKFKTAVGLFVIAVAMGYVVYYQYASNDYLQERLEKTSEGKQSGRLVAYSTLFEHWAREDNLAKSLFGNGMSQSVGVWGNYAHNDWLELLIDNGLLGVVLYASLFICMNKYIRKSAMSPTQKLAAHLCVIFWFLKTIFSMGYMFNSGAIFLFLFGILVGNYERDKLAYRKTRVPVKYVNA